MKAGGPDPLFYPFRTYAFKWRGRKKDEILDTCLPPVSSNQFRRQKFRGVGPAGGRGMVYATKSGRKIDIFVSPGETRR